MRRRRQVAVLQALGNERRLRVLEALLSGERSVGALVTAADLPQNQVSTALAQFASLGLVRRRRDGRHVFYTLAHESVGFLLASVGGVVDQAGAPVETA